MCLKLIKILREQESDLCMCRLGREKLEECIAAVISATDCVISVLLNSVFCMHIYRYTCVDGTKNVVSIRGLDSFS